jgi:hypothetical protein
MISPEFDGGNTHFHPEVSKVEKEPHTPYAHFIRGRENIHGVEPLLHPREQTIVDMVNQCRAINDEFLALRGPEFNG